VLKITLLYKETEPVDVSANVRQEISLTKILRYFVMLQWNGSQCLQMYVSRFFVRMMLAKFPYFYFYAAGYMRMFLTGCKWDSKYPTQNYESFYSYPKI
jgi:hypothetical protein